MPKPCFSQAEYVRRVTAGEGFVPGQDRGGSEAETRFLKKMETRKAELLAARAPVQHPALLTGADLRRARHNLEKSDWGGNWLAQTREIAEHAAGQAAGYVQRMIPELTPSYPSGFACPACEGVRSQPGIGNFRWDYRDPEKIICQACGRAYPDPAFPEAGTLVCPRMGQVFTCFLTPAERAHPEDRSGRHARQAMGHPISASNSAMLRFRKAMFMAGAAKALALMFRFTGQPRYAAGALAILARFAQCHRRWLWHDQYNTIADCAPAYAAWHHSALKLEWKRHFAGQAFQSDTVEKAGMLDNYWGAGRIYPTTGGIHLVLPSLLLAYDLTSDARAANGAPLWDAARRAAVEHLFLDFALDGEPWLNGPAKISNQAPRVFNAIGLLGKCLGLPACVDLALTNYEGIRDQSFVPDGFSRESPNYTGMYLAGLFPLVDNLQGFRWPATYPGRKGKVAAFQSDPFLKLALLGLTDALQPDACYLPLGDTANERAPWKDEEKFGILQIACRHFPRLLRGKMPALSRGSAYGEYALFNLQAEDLNEDTGFAPPEILFPAWKTAILRHGAGREATVLALAFNPGGGHRHHDALNLYYRSRGQKILGDLGYLGTKPQAAWMRSAACHNLVIVDDAEQLGPGPDGRRDPSLRLMATAPRVSVVEASVKAYDQCSDYRRLVALLKGPGADTIAFDIFRVRGGHRHSYRVFSELAASDRPEGRLEFAGLSLPAEPPIPDFGASMQAEHISGLRDLRATGAVPPAWQAAWKQHDGAYRLWMLAQADRAQAAHGPGQEQVDSQMGRRVRYLDAVRLRPGNRPADEFASAFVALHEPLDSAGAWPVKKAQRLVPPAAAGEQAVAVRIATEWGSYLVFSEFRNEAVLEGIRFQGVFGVAGETPQGRRWLFTVGAETCRQGAFGFVRSPAWWTGAIAGGAENGFTTDTDRPAGWPAIPKDTVAYVLVGDGIYTGFPVRALGRRRMRTARFPLQPARHFRLAAVRYAEE